MDESQKTVYLNWQVGYREESMWWPGPAFSEYALEVKAILPRQLYLGRCEASFSIFSFWKSEELC